MPFSHPSAEQPPGDRAPVQQALRSQALGLDQFLVRGTRALGNRRPLDLPAAPPGPDRRRGQPATGVGTPTPYQSPGSSAKCRSAASQSAMNSPRGTCRLPAGIAATSASVTSMSQIVARRTDKANSPTPGARGDDERAPTPRSAPESRPWRRPPRRTRPVSIGSCARAQAKGLADPGPQAHECPAAGTHRHAGPYDLRHPKDSQRCPLVSTGVHRALRSHVGGRGAISTPTVDRPRVYRRHGETQGCNSCGSTALTACRPGIATDRARPP